MLRQLILDAIQRVKDDQAQFKNGKWDNFYYGHFHISEFPFQGIPTDRLLFEFYNEMVDWYYTKAHMK